MLRRRAGRGAASSFDVLFGPAYKGIPLAHRAGLRIRAPRPRPAAGLQPQGSQGPRRRRHADRRAAGRAPRADRRRRDHRRHRDPRSARHHPRRRRHARRHRDRAGPPGARQRGHAQSAAQAVARRTRAAGHRGRHARRPACVRRRKRGPCRPPRAPARLPRALRHRHRARDGDSGAEQGLRPCLPA